MVVPQPHVAFSSLSLAAFTFWFDSTAAQDVYLFETMNHREDQPLEESYYTKKKKKKKKEKKRKKERKKKKVVKGP
jgi:hypothetical protein